MAVIRSAFWLGVAFLAIGPHANLAESATDLAQGAIGVGAAYAQDQIATIACEDLSCTGNKVLVSAGLDMAVQMAGSTAAPEVQPVLLDAPFPAPRTNLRD
ncbi:MAG: hypothetical protein KDJ19_08775 [Hyphomicrobiaceae bacterium]|nr:hypothetical protein [Hyphomicrobiaceae bacterium]MCC0023158.1 hypothetical protein [Hyphomicrobiaceae bacterium]